MTPSLKLAKRAVRTAWILGFALALGAVQAPIVRADPFKSLAKHLIRDAGDLKDNRVIVMPFPYHDGRISPGSSIVSEQLTMCLARIKGVQLVERSLLSKVLQEMNLAQTGALQPETAQQLGNLLEAKAIVTGTLIDQEDEKTEINARIIEVKTGAILAAYSVVIRRTWPELPPEPEGPAVAAVPVAGPAANAPASSVVSAGPVPSQHPALGILAVINFSTNAQGPLKNKGAEISSLLSRALSRRNGLSAVEQADVSKALGETLGISGAITHETKARIYEATGAKIVIGGWALTDGKKLVLIARVGGTQTNHVYGEMVSVSLGKGSGPDRTEVALARATQELSRKIIELLNTHSLA